MSRILHPIFGRVIGAVAVRLVARGAAASSDPTTRRRSRRTSPSRTRCLVDAPWWHPNTVYRQTMLMRHGWDGEVGRYFLVQVDGEDEAVGRAAVHTSDYDNLDLGLGRSSSIRPERRRRGHGTAACSRRFDVARSMGRTKAGWFGWVGERTEGFAKALGCRAEVRRGLPPAAPAASSSRAWPTGCTPRRSRTPATTSCCASSAPTPDELLPGARGGHRGHQRRAAGRHRDGGRGVHRRPGAGLRAGPARQRLTAFYRVIARHRGYRRARRSVGGHRRLARRRPSATSTTPPSCAATAVTGSACCSRPT